MFCILIFIFDFRCLINHFKDLITHLLSTCIPTLLKLMENNLQLIYTMYVRQKGHFRHQKP